MAVFLSLLYAHYVYSRKIAHAQNDNSNFIPDGISLDRFDEHLGDEADLLDLLFNEKARHLTI